MSFNLDQSYTTGQDNDEGSNVQLHRIAADNSQILGQSFTPTLAGPLNKVELYLKKKGTPTGNLWVEIHADGADPSAAAQIGLDSATVDISTAPAAYDYVAFTWASSIDLSPGTEYWILLYGDQTLGTTNSVFWGTDTSSPGYAGGIAGRFGNGSAIWEDIASYDTLFKQYSDDVPTTTRGYVYIL